MSDQRSSAIVPTGDNAIEEQHYVEIFLVSEIEWAGECRCGRSITSISSRTVEEFFDQSCARYPQTPPPENGSDSEGSS